MKSSLQTLFLSVGLAAIGAVAACSSSSSGGNGATTDDGGATDDGGGASTSSGSSSGSTSSGGSSSGTSSSSGSSSGTSSSSGSSSGGTSSGGDSGADSGSSSGGSSGGDSGTTSDAGDGGCSGTLLTVDNYVSWCTVSVNGGATSTDATRQFCVTTGSTVNLSASPANGTFEIGTAPWHKTAGDTGSGDPGTQSGTGTSAKSVTTVVAAGKTQCVYACCPFSADGSGCSGTGFTAPCQ